MSVPGVAAFHDGGGGAGGGIGGSTGATGDRLLASDGTGGSTVKATSIPVAAGHTLTVDSLLCYPDANQSNDEKVQVSESFLFASDVVFRYYNDPDISSGTADLGFVRDAPGIWRFTNGSTGQGAVRCTRPVVTLANGGTITAARTRSAISNNGAAGAGDFELVAAAEGLEYLFTVQTAQAMNVIAAGADVIYIAGVASSAGGSASCATIGSSLLLTCAKAGVWTGIASGTWTLA